MQITLNIDSNVLSSNPDPLDGKLGDKITVVAQKEFVVEPRQS